MKTIKVRITRNDPWIFMNFGYNHEMISWLLVHDYMPLEDNKKRWIHLWGVGEAIIVK